MPNEEQKTTDANTEDPDQVSPERKETGEGGAEDQDVDGAGSEPEAPSTATAESGDEEAGQTLSVRALNRLVPGRLTLHYPERDVTLVLDGEAAIRLLTAFWSRRAGGLADRLDPKTSSALSGWVVCDLDEPLAVSWYPTVGRPPSRTAIDPAVPQVA